MCPRHAAKKKWVGRLCCGFRWRNAMWQISKQKRPIRRDRFRKASRITGARASQREQNLESRNLFPNPSPFWRGEPVDARVERDILSRRNKFRPTLSLAGEPCITSVGQIPG